MFKSPGQRRFLFAMDKDKQKQGIPVNKSVPNSLPTSRPQQMTQPPQVHNLGMQSSPPAYHPPVMGTIKPTAAPSLPALPKMPKFGKVKKYLKKEF